ncbi:Zinc finger, FYVE/PHD-type [Corchorus capsularis]|uniref:Zinc finger, FYVE/PHD-type n=1 Tax=Corchorus capsularis TaxID=210143 RepID=A0A1R3J2B1_COCAP|nr:Zinc finger, FYVE/PHD-type [Corchorus capsularis]
MYILSTQVTVCETCGDRGFAELLVYCEKCQAYAIHRYCLKKVTLGDVFWFCVDCEPEIAVTSTPKQGSPATGPESRLEDCPVSRLDDDIKCLKNKKKSKHDSGSFVISKVQKQSRPLLKPPEDLAKDETLGRKDETLNNKKKSKHDSGSFVISKVQKQSSPLLKPPEDVAKDETLGRKDETLNNKKNSKHDSGSFVISKVQKQSSPLLKPPEDLAEDETLGRKDETLNNNKKSKHDSGSFVISKVQKQSSPLLKPPEDLAKDETLGRKDETLGRPVRVGGPTFNNEDGVFEAKSSVSNTCTSSRETDWVNIDKKAEYVNIRTSSIALNEYLNIVESNLLDCGDRELDGIYSDEVAESVKTKASLVPTRNQIPEHIYLPALPIMEPIWRGSVHLCDGKFLIRVLAHLSSFACLKVCETAKWLPESLCLELLPRCNMWPKGFKRWGPSEDSIALYFFPCNERDTKTFDNLVDKMISQDLGMRAVFQDVELLVFTSRLLPLYYWRFQEKFYLWGVFRSKQASQSTNVVAEDEKNPLDTLTLYSQSPVSPLSNSGSSHLTEKISC